MIIKFFEKDSTVIFGEVDHVEYSEIRKDQRECCGEVKGILKYQPGNTPAKEKCMAMSFFTKNMTEATRIECYSPIYLMNDNGKTIEII
jgi:hypothetical protein